MTIRELVRRWPDRDAAVSHLERVRWAGRPACPRCDSERVVLHAARDAKRPRWRCFSCHTAFNATAGTVFHRTRVPLGKWFVGLTTLLDERKDVSAAQFGRDLKLPHKTAWVLIGRIRKANESDPTQAELFRRIIQPETSGAGANVQFLRLSRAHADVSDEKRSRI